MTTRKQHKAAFKTKVAPEALKGEETAAELTAPFGVHPTMIHRWKRQLLEGASDVFERGRKGSAPEIDDEKVRELHAKIGELTVANVFFLAKAQTLDRDVRGSMVEREHPALSVMAQCRLLSIPRSSFTTRPAARRPRTWP